MRIVYIAIFLSHADNLILCPIAAKKETAGLLKAKLVLTQEKTMENGQEWNIGQLLGTSSVYWRSSTVHAAVKLEIFSVIGDGQLTVEEVSDSIGGKPRSVAMLLNGLTAMGLLKHENKSYKNTDFSRSCLVKGEPGYI